MKLFKKAKKGFTLVELVVVIAVIAILAAVSVGTYFGVTDSANRSKLEQEAKQTFEAIRLISLADPENNQNLGIDGLTLDTTDDGVAEFTNDLMYATGQTYTVSLEEKPQEGITGKTVVLYKNFLDLGTSNVNGSNQTYKSFNYYTNEVKSYAANVNLINGKIEIISDEFEITPPAASTAVTGVSLNTTSYDEMVTGDTYTLSATVTPDTATDKSVSWSSNDTSVVTVNNGVVTAVGAGSATVTVTTTDGNKTASCTFTVEDPVIDAEAIGITTNAPENFYVGDAQITLEAQITPADTTNKTITWSSSAPEVASVVAETGVVTPLAKGTAVITAKTHNNKTDTITIVVKQHATKVELDQESISMHVGDNDIQLNATVTPDNADNKNVTWESSDESVATVNNGKVHAVGNGNATITVKTVDGEHTDTCSVSVKTHATSVTITQGDSVEVNENGTVQLSATVLPETSSYTTITWSSSDDTKATVDANGLVAAAANGKGQVTITASCDGKEDQITVNILRPVNSFGLSETSKALYVDGEFTLTPNFNNEEPSNTNVTWESSDDSVATVDNGVVTAHKAGTATITAVTENSSKQATCVVTVYTKLNSVTLNNGQAISLNNGQTSDEISVTFDPADYSVAERTTSRSSDEEAVATVTDGVVKATGKGTATITYTVNDGIQDVSGSITVNVANPVTGITLPGTATVDQYSTIILTPTITPENPDAYTITWSSDYEEVATVSNGVVKGIAPGTANIKAYIAEGIEATCAVTVNEAANPNEYGLILDVSHISDGDYVFFGNNSNIAMKDSSLRGTNHIDGGTIESTSISSYYNSGSVLLPESHDVAIFKVEKVTDSTLNGGKDNVFAFKYESENRYLYSTNGGNSGEGTDANIHRGDLRNNACYQLSTNEKGEFIVENLVATVNGGPNMRGIAYNTDKNAFGSYNASKYPVQIFKRNHTYVEPELESFTLSVTNKNLTVGDEVTISLGTITPSFYTTLDLTFEYDEDLFDLVTKTSTSIKLKATSVSDGTSVTAKVNGNPSISSEVSDIKIAENAITPEPDVEPAWNLVTNVSDLQIGDKIIIAASGFNNALSTTQNSNNRGKTTITKSGDKNTLTVEPSSSVQIITLETGNKSNTFAFNVGNGYLYAASSSSNYLRTQTNINDNASWSISVTNSGVATIEAQGTNSNNLLKYNSSSSLFSCYSSGQQDIVIYKLHGEYNGGSDSGATNPETPSTNGNTIEQNSFSDENGSLDSNVSYTTAKGGGTANPQANDGQIRLYQNSNGTGGGTITIEVKEGFKLTEVTIGSGMSTSIAYTIGSSTTKSTSVALSKDGKYNVTDIHNTSITFYCMGTSSSSRLYVNYLKVTYVANS